MKNAPKLAALLAAGALATTALAQEVVIGWSGAITGPTSDAGQFVAQGVEDYCAWANENEVVPGYEIRCIVRDDQYDNDNTLRNFEAYLDEDMDAFLSYATGGTLQLKLNAVEEEIPVISSSLHIGVIDPPDDEYNFLPTTSYSEQVVALLDWIADNHEGDEPARVAMLVHPSPFGRAPVEDAREAAEMLGVEIVEVQEHGDGTDYTAMLQRWSNEGVGYVIGQTVQSPIAAMLNSAQALGLKDEMTFLGAHYTGGNTLVSLAGDAADGFLWATSIPLPEQIPMQGELASTYGRSGQTAADDNYASGALQTSIFVEAARRVVEAGGEPDPATIYEELLAMNEEAAGAYESPFGLGPVTYSESDRVGVDALHLLQVEDGAFVELTEPFSSETFQQVHGN